MKVCIIGSGAQGTGLAGLLAMEPDVEKLVIADYSERSLQSAKSQLHSLGDKIQAKEITVRQVDASSTADVAEVIRGCDIVFHCIIPKFNIPIMKACLQEKCNYLDLFAAPYEGNGISYDETIDAQLALDQEFREINRIALPSVGMSPGWTSLAAQYMIDGMDTVDSVIIRWGDFINTDEFLAPVSPYVLYHEWFGAPGPVRTVDGACEVVGLVESEETFRFPEPIGERSIYTVTSHPDIVLIPRFADKPVHICEEKGGIFIGKLSMKDVWIKGIQAATAEQGDSENSINMMESFGKTLLQPREFGRLLSEGKIRDHAVCFSCEVSGQKDGGTVHHTCYYTSTLEEAQKHLSWASPAVYGTVGGMPIELVLRIGRGMVPQTGVWSVGNLGIAKELNEAMAHRGQIITETIERTVGV